MACGQAGSGCALKTRLSSGSNLSRSARTSTPAILRWLPGRVGTPQFCGVRHRNNAITPILPTKTAIRPGSSAARQRIGRWPDTSIRSWRWPGMSGCHQLGGSRYEGRLLGGPGLGVANLPGRAVVHLCAVQQRDNVCGGVNRIAAALENVLLGPGTEHGKMVCLE